MQDILNPTEVKQKYIPKNVKHEQRLQLDVCNYIRTVKPNAIFRSDFASGMRLSIHQATLHKKMQSSRAWPDLMIFEPRECTLKDGSKEKFCGMAIELKREGTTIIVKKGPRAGKISSDPHIQEQYWMLKDLAKRGWYVNFAAGFDEFEQMFRWYFGLPKTDQISFF
jgi:hypothetical protein